MHRASTVHRATRSTRRAGAAVGSLSGRAGVGQRDLRPAIAKKLRANAREQPALRKLEQRLQWTDIISALEQVKGEKWEAFSPRHGDWGRDAALWLGRRRGRYTLSELGQLAGGVDYAAVGQAISRFGKRIQTVAELRRSVTRIEEQLSKLEMLAPIVLGSGGSCRPL